MPDTPPYHGSDLDADGDAATPRWVKVFGIIALVVILLFVILMFTRGPGGHGPRRHMPSGNTGNQVPSAKVAEVAALPEGGHG